MIGNRPQISDHISQREFGRRLDDYFGPSGASTFLLQDQGREALTQALGRLAREHGFTALLAPSAARARGTNVVIYPDRIAAGSRIAVVNPEHLPPRPG